MKIIILVICFQFVTTSVISQYSEVIYLKNGSIIKGRIRDIKPNEYVKFETKDGSIWVFETSEIEKFDTDELGFKVNFEKDTLVKHFLQTDIGFLVGTTENEMKAPLSFLASWNIPLFYKIYGGIATGFEFYQMTYIPVLVDIRYKPYFRGLAIYVQSGYTMPINKKGTILDYKYEFEPGFLINPGVSYTFMANHGTAFTISLGYRYQKTFARQLDRYYNDDYQRIDILNRMDLRFGYSFR